MCHIFLITPPWLTKCNSHCPAAGFVADDSAGTLYMLLVPQQGFCGLSAVASDATDGSPVLTAISTCDSNSASEQFTFISTSAMGAVNQSAEADSTSYW